MLEEIRKTAPKEIAGQLDDNIHWIKEAGKNKLVVGSQARILYADSEGRTKIALAFNDAIARGEISAPVDVSQTEKIIFPIVGLLLTCFLVPSGLPLLGMLFFGNLLKESGVTRRLAETARGPLIDVITILLGVTVGASTQASQFLTGDSVKIFVLGAISFIIATTAGVLFVKFFNLFLKKDNKINPLIGNAGVSAVPDSARISQVLGLEYDPSNYLLMHAMGPNVAGVIGSAVAAGILLGFLG